MTELLLALAAICQINGPFQGIQEGQRACVAEILECINARPLRRKYAEHMAMCIKPKTKSVE